LTRLLSEVDQRLHPNDRLIIAGSDDPLLHRAVSQLARKSQTAALVSYTSSGTKLGLSLLARQRADVCAIHWGQLKIHSRSIATTGTGGNGTGNRFTGRDEADRYGA